MASLQNIIPKLDSDIEENMVKILDEEMTLFNENFEFDSIALTKRVQEILKNCKNDEYDPATYKSLFSNDLEGDYKNACYHIYQDYTSKKNTMLACDFYYHIMISFILSERVDLMAKGIYGLNLIGSMTRAAPWWGLVLEVVAYKAKQHPCAFIACLYEYVWGYGYDGHSPNVTIDIVDNNNIKEYVKCINLWQTYNINKNGKWRFKQRRTIPEMNSMYLECDDWENENDNIMRPLLKENFKKMEIECVNDDKANMIRLFPLLGLVYKFIKEKRVHNVYFKSLEEKGLRIVKNSVRYRKFILTLKNDGYFIYLMAREGKGWNSK